MKLKTIYGQEIDTDLIGNGFGDFGAYVRANFDKEWGMSEKREAAGTKKYTVSLGGTATVCGYYTVDAHSEEEARELARVIEHDDKYHGEKVRLLSCSTGAVDDGFAQDLANALGVEVEAPTDVLLVYPDGRMKIGYDGSGKMKTFKPYGRE